jgi:hypothetical protein
MISGLTCRRSYFKKKDHPAFGGDAATFGLFFLADYKKFNNISDR